MCQYLSWAVVKTEGNAQILKYCIPNRCSPNQSPQTDCIQTTWRTLQKHKCLGSTEGLITYSVWREGTKVYIYMKLSMLANCCVVTNRAVE